MPVKVLSLEDRVMAKLTCAFKLVPVIVRVKAPGVVDRGVTLVT